MSYTAPQYVDTKEQAVLALASTIAGEDKTALGDGSVNTALDVLADVLAGQDVDVPQTNAGAILALAQYVGGGGGGGALAGNYVGLAAVTEEPASYDDLGASPVDGNLRMNGNIAASGNFFGAISGFDFEWLGGPTDQVWLVVPTSVTYNEDGSVTVDFDKHSIEVGTDAQGFKSVLALSEYDDLTEPYEAEYDGETELFPCIFCIKSGM